MLRLLSLLSLTALCLGFPGRSSGQGKKCGTYNTCVANAHCTKTDGYFDCVCNNGYYGSGYTNCTTKPECITSKDCDDDEECEQNVCRDVCVYSCPEDAGCTAKDHKATCVLDGKIF